MIDMHQIMVDVAKKNTPWDEWGAGETCTVTCGNAYQGGRERVLHRFRWEYDPGETEKIRKESNAARCCQKFVASCPTWLRYQKFLQLDKSFSSDSRYVHDVTGEPTVAMCRADNIDPQGDVVGLLSEFLFAPAWMCISDVVSGLYPLVI
jgi:hypothetical protein